MASANWTAASELQSRIPHTYTAMEHLIMAMADAYNHRGKTTFFGNDKGLKSYKKFEEKLKDALFALSIDGLVPRAAPANEYREMLAQILVAWFEIFPNWPDACNFAAEKLARNSKEANSLISSLIGVKA